MNHKRDEQLPQELGEVAEQLQAGRAELSPLELDRIKVRAMEQSRRSSSRASGAPSLRSRLATIFVLTGLVVSGGTAGVIAGSGGGGSASDNQYRPGKGCGDTNHTHTGPPGTPDNTDCPATNTTTSPKPPKNK